MSVEVIDDFLPQPLAWAAFSAFPDHAWKYWHRYKGETADKFGSMDRLRIPEACLKALDAIASKWERRTKDNGCFVDYDLHAAGLHMIPPGGFLSRHLDAERHPLQKWQRTHSIVLFLNPGWREGDGGRLLIEGHAPIDPVFNRCVIFKTPGTWHEVEKSTFLSPPRRSLALFAWNLMADPRGRSQALFEQRNQDAISCADRADCGLGR